MEETKIHLFELAGLGKAPFKLVGLVSIPPLSLCEANPDAYNNALRNLPRDVGCGTCHYCGMGIMNNFIIQSSDGKKSAVGCDCVDKVGDHGLTTEVKVAKKKAAREKSEEQRVARYNARLAEEMKANGGLTNDEVRANKLATEKKARDKKLRPIIKMLAPLAETLADGGNGFRDSIAADMLKGIPPHGRAVGITLDILAKMEGRSNSKAYQAEYDRLDKIIMKALKMES